MRSSFSSLSPRAALVALAGLMAALVVAPITFADADVAAAGKCVTIDFLYNDGAVDKGSFCDQGNELTKAEHGIVANTLHISCSDMFVGGVAEKSDLGGRTVTRWSIRKFKDGEFKSECGSVTGPDSGDTDVEKAKKDKAEKDAEKAAKEAEKQAEKDAKHAEKAAKYAAKDAEKAAKDAEKQAEKDAKDAKDAADKKHEKCVLIDFVYSDGLTDKGEYCSGNTLTSSANGINVPELHVSCSDQFPGGVAEKSDLGLTADGSVRTVTSWSIEKFKDGEFKSACGGGTTPPPPPPAQYCYDYDFSYAATTTSGDDSYDAGRICDTSTVTRSNTPGLVAVSLDVSCTKSDASIAVFDGKLKLHSYSVSIFKDGLLVESCQGSF